MRHFVALCFFVGYALAVAVTYKLKNRIVNGKETTIEFNPYQVSLHNKDDGSYICGGCIINKDIIVTAAHCVVTKKPAQLNVRLGSTFYNEGGKLIAVRALKYHEDFNNTTMVYDVAVMKLATPVPESSTIRFITLSQKIPPTGTAAVVTGWGSKCFIFCKEMPKVLQSVKVFTVSKDECASKKFGHGNKVKESMFCAYDFRKDSCHGDSGSPLVAKNKLIGIVSWGNGCAIKRFPGVYCNVAAVKDWIQQTAKEL